MEGFRLIPFYQTRDFSAKIDATFQFIRQNFKPLGKALLTFAGPLILAASITLGNFIRSMFNLTQSIGRYGQGELVSYYSSPAFLVQLVLMFLLMIISSVVAISTVNNYLLLYAEKKTNAIRPGEVWERVQKTFWVYFGSAILFGFLGMVVYIILLIPMFVLTAISPYLALIGVIVFIGGFVYLFVASSLTFYVIAQEKKSIFDALGRSFQLVKTKWWSTFGQLAIFYTIVMIGSYIFLIPGYAAVILTQLHLVSSNSQQDTLALITLIFSVSFGLQTAAQLLLTAIPNIGIAFQYYNLVELKESRGLIGDLSAMHENQTPLVADPHEQY